VRNLASKTKNISLSCRAQQAYFDILNPLGVDHHCDRQTDGQNYDSTGYV